MKYFLALCIGIYFGILLIKGDVANWHQIQAMFRFESAYMYLVIGSAVFTGLIFMQVIQRFTIKTVSGNSIQVTKKEFNKGTIIGGFIFGCGWAITGACPGPILAQIAAGEWAAVFTFIGALAGTFSYSVMRPKLPH